MEYPSSEALHEKTCMFKKFSEKFFYVKTYFEKSHEPKNKEKNNQKKNEWKSMELVWVKEPINSRNRKMNTTLEEV